MPAAKHVMHTGEARGEMTLPDGVFGTAPNEHVMWEAVRRHLVNQRQGTAAVKNRKQVSGGGRKPWRQKGTGRARSGTSRSPLWVGGARAFGPIPRDYRLDMPKRVRRLAVRSALSTKAAAGEITIVSDFKLPAPKTREMRQVLKNLAIGPERCLLVLPEHDGVLALAARNIANLRTLDYRLLNAYEVLHADRVILMESAVSKIEEALKS